MGGPWCSRVNPPQNLPLTRRRSLLANGAHRIRRRPLPGGDAAVMELMSALQHLYGRVVTPATAVANGALVCAAAWLLERLEKL